MRHIENIDIFEMELFNVRRIINSCTIVNSAENNEKVFLIRNRYIVFIYGDF